MPWSWLLAGQPAFGGDIASIITDLYGGDGITLSEDSGFGHDAHFTAESLRSLDQLAQAVASDAGLLSFNSVVTGFKLDLNTGVPVRTTESLGPLLAESATTLGKNTLNVGFTFTRVEYTHFEGDNLEDLSVVFNHPDVNGDGRLGPFIPRPGGPLLDFETDQIRVDIDLKLKQEIFAMHLSYGLMDQWDIGLILPIIRTEAEAVAIATVLDPTPSPSPHFFDPVNGDSPESSLRRTRTGIGDLVLRTKYRLAYDREHLPDVAIGGQVVLPTGNEDNLHGTGDVRLQGVAIVSKSFENVTPHLNLGYEWTPEDHQRNSLRFILGVDVVVNEWCTLAADLLGRWEHDGDGIGDLPINFAVGSKLQLLEQTYVNGGVQLPLNIDDGLRAELIFFVGIEHTFH